jgi:thiamine biosynthesis protein ThiS
MTITLNGATRPHPEAITILQLLHDLGLDGKPVVVELDGQAVFPRDHAQTLVQPGARVEIVTLAAGG